jgi:aspartate aminotransferase-like enzyme
MKQTAVEWLMEIDKSRAITIEEWQQAREMEKVQMGYTKEDVFKAGEMGEINHHDTKHIVSYLDEAKQYNETFDTNKK